MDAEVYANELALARNRVSEMDRIDGYKERSLRTVFLALECGLKRPQSGAAFDALVMLEDVCGLKAEAEVSNGIQD